MSAETGTPIPFDADALPCGKDRAEGVDVNMGTAAEDGQVLVTSSDGGGTFEDPGDRPIEEEPDSPVLENAEQQTITHRFNGGINNILTEHDMLHRGIIRTDSQGYFHKLLSAVAQYKDAHQGTLQTVDEVMSGDTPPDTIEIVPVDLALSIIKHPRYFYSFLGDGLGSATEKQNQMVIRMLQNYFENTTAPFRDAIHAMFKASLAAALSGGSAGFGAQPVTATPADATTGVMTWPNWNADGTYTSGGSLISGTAMALAAALEVVTKYWRGLEQPPVYGWQVVWTEFSWAPLPLNPGGYVVIPLTTGGWVGPEVDAMSPLPDFLSDTNFPPLSSDTPEVNSMFAGMQGVLPQCYSDDGTTSGKLAMSCRREPDQPVRDRTFWATQHKWVITFIGYWDPDLFSRGNRPSVPTDYNTAA